MPRTPDRWPGTRIETAVQYTDENIAASSEGDTRYKSGAFSFYDEDGEYDPRKVALNDILGATEIGQVLMSIDGVSFSAQLPVTANEGGWLTNDDGYLMIVG